MRLVLSAYPSREAAETAVRSTLDRKLVACASLLPVASRYWWNAAIETADEWLVLFKTVPKRVGALFDHLLATHPYDVPEVAELDVGRVAPGYLAYLVRTLDPSSLEPPERLPTRRGAPRGRGARAPGRTLAPHRRRSRRTGTSR